MAVPAKNNKLHVSIPLDLSTLSHHARQSWVIEEASHQRRVMGWIGLACPAMRVPPHKKKSQGISFIAPIIGYRGFSALCISQHIHTIHIFLLHPSSFSQSSTERSPKTSAKNACMKSKIASISRPDTFRARLVKNVCLFSNQTSYLPIRCIVRSMLESGLLNNAQLPLAPGHLSISLCRFLTLNELIPPLRILFD